jgi:hypothetical protein
MDRPQRNRAEPRVERADRRAEKLDLLVPKPVVDLNASNSPPGSALEPLVALPLIEQDRGQRIRHG